jgi:hypothetical protein
MTRIVQANSFLVPWHSESVQILGSTQKFAESENGLQVFCVEYTKQKFGKACKLHHSANERLGWRAGALAKRMGQSKGFPDLIIYQLTQPAAGLTQPAAGLTQPAAGGILFPRPATIEFKIKKNQLTPEQKDWLDYFKSIGYITATVRTFDEYKKVLEEILKS